MSRRNPPGPALTAAAAEELLELEELELEALAAPAPAPALEEILEELDPELLLLLSKGPPAHGGAADALEVPAAAAAATAAAAPAPARLPARLRRLIQHVPGRRYRGEAAGNNRNKLRELYEGGNKKKNPRARTCVRKTRKGKDRKKKRNNIRAVLVTTLYYSNATLSFFLPVPPSSSPRHIFTHATLPIADRGSE